jgi:tripartite-type tricarboxylate transporter receptor subunit TctC
VRVLGLPDVRERLSARGAVAKGTTPEEFDRFVRAEVEKLAKIVRAAGVKTQ